MSDDCVEPGDEREQGNSGDSVEVQEAHAEAMLSAEGLYLWKLATQMYAEGRRWRFCALWGEEREDLPGV
jgi:hypothetical protein